MWRSELHDTACCKYAQIPPCRSLSATSLPQRAERATCGGASYMTPRAVNMHRFHHVAPSMRRRSLNGAERDTCHEKARI